MNIPEGMSQLTYRIEHNPNCPMPFLVRLPSQGWITGSDEDCLGYGKTVEKKGGIGIS